MELHHLHHKAGDEWTGFLPEVPGGASELTCLAGRPIDLDVVSWVSVFFCSATHGITSFIQNRSTCTTTRQAGTDGTQNRRLLLFHVFILFLFFTKASSTWAPEVFQTPCLSCSKLRYRIPNGFGVVRCWGWGPDSEFIPLPCALYRGGRWETVQTSTPIPIMKINSTPILTDVYGL